MSISLLTSAWKVNFSAPTLGAKVFGASVLWKAEMDVIKLSPCTEESYSLFGLPRNTLHKTYIYLARSLIRSVQNSDGKAQLTLMQQLDLLFPRLHEC